MMEKDNREQLIDSNYLPWTKNLELQVIGRLDRDIGVKSVIVKIITQKHKTI